MWRVLDPESPVAKYGLDTPLPDGNLPEILRDPGAMPASAKPETGFTPVRGVPRPETGSVEDLRYPDGKPQPGCPPSWLAKTDEFLALLRDYPLDNLDRNAVQKLTGLGRSGAVNLMNRFGAEQWGHSFVIRKTVLIDGLREARKTPGFAWIVKHRVRLGETLEQARLSLRARALSVQRPRVEAAFDEIAGVDLNGADLSFRCADRLELVQKLYAFTKAIEREPDRFLEGDGPTLPFAP